MKNSDVVILAAKRSPFGKLGSALKDWSTAQLAVPLVRELIHGRKPELIERLVLGNVYAAGEGQNIARQIIAGAGLSKHCGSRGVTRVCSSGLEALRDAYFFAKEYNELVIACGADSMSKAPYLYPRPAEMHGHIDSRNSENVRKILTSQGSKRELPPVNTFTDLVDSMLHDGLCDASIEGNPHMGELADWFAKECSISRATQDEYAFESYRRAYIATKNNQIAQGLPTQEAHVYPISYDEGIREPNLEKLRQLKPVFGEHITAGNASQLSDGAGALLVTTHKRAEKFSKFGWRELARIVAFGDYAGENHLYLSAPVDATCNVLATVGMLIDDVDLLEVHEPFAVGPVYFLDCFSKGFNLTRQMLWDRMNIWGGSIAVGHPLSATGIRLVENLVYGLMYTRGRYGLAVACNGGGEAVAVIIENLQR